MNDRIKQIRKESQLSQSEFGKRIGVSRDVIANLENGRVAISDTLLDHLCEIYGVNEEWVKNGSGEMFIRKDKQEEISKFLGSLMEGKEDSFKKRFIISLSQLNESDWKVIKDFAYKLAEKKDGA